MKFFDTASYTIDLCTRSISENQESFTHRNQRLTQKSCTAYRKTDESQSKRKATNMVAQDSMYDEIVEGCLNHAVYNKDHDPCKHFCDPMYDSLYILILKMHTG